MIRPNTWIRRTCRRCHGRKQLGGCASCGGSGYRDDPPDLTAVGLMGGAASIQGLLAHLIDLIEAHAEAEARAVHAGDREGAIVLSARRSGLSEAAVGIDLYLCQSPKLTPAEVGHA